MYCDNAIALADSLQEFIHFLWIPTASIWGCVCVAKVLNSVFSGL